MNRSGRAAWPVVLALLAFALEPWQFPHDLRSARAAEVLTNQNVIAMAKAGLPESLILSKIQSTDARFDLSSSGLISLKQGGVSDTVLLAMMNRQNAGSTTASAAPPPAPAYQPPPAPGQPAPPPAYQPPAYSPPAPQSAPGCPQLSQPDPYQDMRGALAQLRAQAGQPGAPNQAQVQPLVAQVQSAIDARDAALRQGACDTSQYDQQIGTMVASLQSALNAPAAGSAPPPGYSPPPGSQPPPAPGYQAGAPPGYPQQGGQPQPGYQYPPQAAGAQPGAPGAQMPSAGEIFSKIFDLAVQKFAGKSKKGGDGGSGFSSGNQPPPGYTDPSAGQPGYASPQPGYAPPPAYTDPSAGQPGYASPTPGYASPPPGYSAPPPGYAPPPSYGQPQPGAAPPPGYAPPPPSYTPPPTGYTPPPSYTPPPTGYVPPPSAPPTGYVPPPPVYTPPPPSYTPPPTTGSVAPPPTYAPPPGATQSTSPSGLTTLLPIPQRSTAASPQSAAVVPVLPPKPFPVPADVQGLGRVAGVVRGDSGVVIPGAIVSVVEWNKMMSTGSDGSFSLQGPAAQRLTIQVQAYGYNTQTIVVSAGPGAVTTQNVALVWARRPVGTLGR